MRARNIKPGFFENEQLAELPFEARLLFAGLWCYADREGRFEWRPKRIKALLFPYDNQITTDVIESHLMSLHVMTLILQYKSGDSFFGVIPNFKKHQNPHPHEAKSILPDPEKGVITIQKTGLLVSVPKEECLSTNGNGELNQCHDMSVKCNADIMNPDIMNPDSKNNIACPENTEVPKQKPKYDRDFESAWKNHPRKDGSKWNAFKKWKTLKRTKALPSLETLLESQNNQKQSKKWREGYVPYFETWLNGRMWEAEVQEESNNKNGQSENSSPDPEWY